MIAFNILTFKAFAAIFAAFYVIGQRANRAAALRPAVVLRTPSTRDFKAPVPSASVHVFNRGALR
jgi:hypothetical protein